MITALVLISLGEFGPESSMWKQYRHDARRTGRSPLVGACGSVSEMYDVVHGGYDLSVVTADVNGDGDHDIITAEYDYDGIQANDGSSGSRLWLRYMSGEYFGRPMASVAVSQNVGRVYAVGQYRFWVLSLSSGSVIYSTSKSWEEESPLISDADGDGCPEIYTSISGYAYSIDGCASSFSYNWRASLSSDAHAPAMGDVDGDGDWEVLFPARNGYIYVYDALTGSLHSSFNAGIPSSRMTPDYTVAVEDLDGDGKDEVVVPRPSEVRVYEYNSSWSLVWSRSVSNATPVALGDKNGDGLPDVWIRDGSELKVFRGYDGATLGSTSGLGMDGFPPTLVHLNTDGIVDAVVLHSGHYIRFVNGATMGIMGTYGYTSYSVTSEVVPLKLSPTTIGFTVGDYSCHITTWGTCLLSASDEDLAVDETPGEGWSFSVKDGLIEITAPEGSTVALYDSEGRLAYGPVESKGTLRIRTSDLSKGVYILKVGRSIRRVILR